MGESVYQDFPWRKTSNLFHALTAEIFLQRTRVNQVIPVYLQFTARYNSPADVIGDGKRIYQKMLVSLGLSWRIPVFVDLCQSLVRDHSNRVPDQMDSLLSLPGIGDYIASAYLCFRHNKQLPVVDTNTVRFIGRFFGWRSNSESRRNKKFRTILFDLMPERNSRRFNLGLLDFSMTICGVNPKCAMCLVRRKCKYYSLMTNK